MANTDKPATLADEIAKVAEQSPHIANLLKRLAAAADKFGL